MLLMLQDPVSFHLVQISTRGASLVVQGLRIHLPKQETKVRSLVGELRSRMSLANGARALQ